MLQLSVEMARRSQSLLPTEICKSCGVQEVALRFQVSRDLWGSPGAMEGASLVRVKKSELGRSKGHTQPCPYAVALPSTPGVCQAEGGLQERLLPLWGGG